jgi:hypothetical protein
MPQGEFTYNSMSYTSRNSCHLRIGRRNIGVWKLAVSKSQKMCIINYSDFFMSPKLHYFMKELETGQCELKKW